MSGSLLETQSGKVLILCLNRPDSLNSLDAPLMKRLRDSVRAAAENDSVGCVVLTGSGKGFCSGGDVRAIQSAAKSRVESNASTPDSTDSRTRWLRRSAEVSQLLHEMPKPTIAMINGACAGAGLSLAAACDMRFAAQSSKFRPAFTSNGMPGDYGGSWLWTHILGTAKARQLYFLDELRDASQALAFGLVDRVIDDDALQRETLAVAERLAAAPAPGLAYAKANLNAALTENFASALDRESLSMMRARDVLVAARKAAAART